MNGRGEITGSAVREFAWNSVVWLIPAVIILPLYLVVLAISVIASEGELLGVVLRIRGGMHSALGVLLLLVAAALAVYLLQHGSLTANDWVQGGFMVLATAATGAYFVHRELRKIATRDAAE